MNSIHIQRIAFVTELQNGRKHLENAANFKDFGGKFVQIGQTLLHEKNLPWK